VGSSPTALIRQAAPVLLALDSQFAETDDAMRPAFGMRKFAALVRTPEVWALGAVGAVTVLLLRSIGHDRIEVWDEGFHAIVASHLARDPLVPTLYERQWLPGSVDWLSSTIWLHKPPVALWQIAAAFRLLGVDGFALRVPSVVCLWGAVLAVYALGRSLYHDRWVGALAAGLLALNPFVLGLIEGDYASDHVDVALLCYVAGGLGLLMHAARRSTVGRIVPVGIAVGLAILTKGPPGLLVLGLAVAMYLAQRLEWAGARGLCLNAKALGGISAIALGVALPWYVYTAVRWPAEFHRESGGWLQHLTVDVEGWKAPWDRHLFDYMVQQAPWLYLLLLIAIGVAMCYALSGGLGDAFVVAWVCCVVLPFSVAASKVPALTVIALPALLLAFARVVVRALLHRRFMEAWALCSGAIALAVVRKGRSELPWGKPFPAEVAGSWAPTLAQNSWLATELAIALTVLIVGYVVWRGFPRLVEPLRRAGLAAAIPVVLVCGVLYTRDAVRVVRRDRALPCWHELALVLQRMEPPVVVLYADTRPSDRRYMTLMFWSHRPVYSTTLPLKGVSVDSAARRIREQGGNPVLVARKGAVQDRLASCRDDGRAVYRLSSR
jgi:hypothetical protein